MVAFRRWLGLAALLTFSSAFVARAALPPAPTRRPIGIRPTQPDPRLSNGGVAVRGSAVEEFVGEATGTCLLLTLGFGAVATQAFATAPVGPFGMAVVWGVGAVFGILAAADLSGAHLNPAVTLSLAAFRGFPARKVPRYVVAQLCGSAAAAALTAATWAPLAPAGPLGAYPFLMSFSVPTPTAAFVEAWQTALLVTAVYVTTGASAAVPKKASPFVVGLVLAGLICLGGPITGAGYNPARDVGPRLIAALGGAGFSAAFPPGWWAYTLGPLAGALVGAAFCVHVLKSDGTWAERWVAGHPPRDQAGNELPPPTKPTLPPGL